MRAGPKATIPPINPGVQRARERHNAETDPRTVRSTTRASTTSVRPPETPGGRSPRKAFEREVSRSYARP